MSPSYHNEHHKKYFLIEIIPLGAPRVCLVILGKFLRDLSPPTSQPPPPQHSTTLNHPRERDNLENFKKKSRPCWNSALPQVFCMRGCITKLLFF
ncbi:hypothetical protein CEXT_779201 [Caerostris extrusa]|uniref:Uncharacterized protein n=1 Tax=Caerostris extrusa TaxID=172846 RepID=A0AAV4X2Q4_CAEEX|nr:hypothetical protein CEXT_779201 [Caerostris extrusa]